MSADRKPVVSGGGPGMRGNFSRRFRTAEQIEISARSGDRAVLPLLIRALGDRNPALHQAASIALPKLGDSGFHAVLRAAAHGNKRQREEAVVLLGRWGDVRAVSPLLLALHHDGKERRLRNIRLFLTMVSYQLLSNQPRWRRYSAIGILQSYDRTLDEDRYSWNWYLAAKRDIVLRTRAADALGLLGDVRTIVPLIRLMYDQDAEVSNAAQNALCQLMPIAAALSPDQFRTLGDDAALALAGLLATASEPLTRSTLTALSVCCDPRILPAVQSLAVDQTRPVVQTMAQHLALRLHEHAAQEQLRTTLLRGSASPHGSDSDQLLRAAYGMPPSSVDGSQLLRPTGAETPLDTINS